MSWAFKPLCKAIATDGLARLDLILVYIKCGSKKGGNSGTTCHQLGITPHRPGIRAMQLAVIAVVDVLVELETNAAFNGKCHF